MIRVQGHFGEWIQGRMRQIDDVALVTLSCPELCVCIPPRGTAVPTFLPDATLTRFAQALGLTEDWSEVSCDMPVGGGAGASTAYLVAQARARGKRDPGALAQACIDAEGASDPLMYPDPDQLLWASRQGRVICQTAPPPRAAIIGGFWGASIVTDPSDKDFPEIDDLIPGWTRACETADLGAAAQVAALSAARTTQMRGPDDPMSALARDLGALGHIRAHTGSARGLIFRPGEVPDTARDALTAAGLTSIMQFETGGA